MNTSVLKSFWLKPTKANDFEMSEWFESKLPYKHDLSCQGCPQKNTAACTPGMAASWRSSSQARREKGLTQRREWNAHVARLRWVSRLMCVVVVNVEKFPILPLDYLMHLSVDSACLILPPFSVNVMKMMTSKWSKTLADSPAGCNCESLTSKSILESVAARAL